VPMRKTLSHYAAALAVMLLLGGPSLPAQQAEQAAPTSRFVPFASFRPKFHNDSETFSLTAQIYIVNASPQGLKDVTYRQAFPPEMKPRLVSDAIESQLSHPPEFWHKYEGSTYVMYEPKILRRQPATLLSELSLERRMSIFTIPPTEIEFTITNEGPGKEQTLPVTIDVTEYANHVGDLERFLRKKASISFDIKASGRDEWEFFPIDAVASGKNPEGISGVETSDNGYSGNFRLHNGVPGDALDILVIWKMTQKDRRLQDEKAVMDNLSEYLKWTGPFKFEQESTKISKGKFKKYDAWILEGRWYDTIPKHLGSGPVKALVFFSPREDVEYYLILQAQGRGAGPERADVPAPEKEKELTATLEKILGTFRSDIFPISYNR
jgi:hypothetical protein